MAIRKSGGSQRASLACAIGLAVAFGQLGATLAEPVPAAPVPPQPLPHCQAANALSAIACELSAGLPAELGHLAVAAAPVEAEAGERLDELSARLVHVVAGRFPEASEIGTESLAVARGRAGEANQLLYLRPRVNEGHFEVTADLYPVVRGFWNRFKAVPGPLSHVFSSRRLDAEVGSFLPVPKLLGKVEAKAELPTDNVTALACEDVDGDRTLEVVVAGRRDLLIGRPLSGRFTALGQVGWQQLSPVAPAPLRQPIASLFVESGRVVRWGSTDRRDMVELAPNLAVVSRVAGKQPWGNLGCAERRGQGLGSAVTDCAGTRTFEQAGTRGELDVAAGATLVTSGGSVRVLATRALGQGALQVQDGDGRLAQLQGAGAQVALGDLNRDGLLEILSSKDTLDRQQDELSVHSWRPEGLSLQYRLRVPSGIDAVAVCPAEDQGSSIVVVATRRELWFVR